MIHELVKSIKNDLDKTFIDVKNPTASDLVHSMEYSQERLEYLCDSIQKYVTPCFPPYYCVFDNIKKIYMDYIC